MARKPTRKTPISRVGGQVQEQITELEDQFVVLEAETATFEYVDTSIAAAIAALIASSPATLDTLNELAAALGDDENFASTMTTALAGKQAVAAMLTLLAALADPGADRILFWDESANAFVWLELGTNLSITGTTLDAAGGAGGSVATDTIFDVKGDLPAGTGSDTAARLPVGANDTFLVPDSGTGTGLKWITAAAVKALLLLVKGDVGLGNADNTSDVNKPVSTAQAAADAVVQAFAIDRANHSGTQAQSTITGLVAVLALLAPLANAPLTGTPTAPTATLGTNTTQLATTAFVEAAVAALIGTAPGVLDTLGEISDAINDDANLYTTLTALIAAKQPSDADLTAIAALTTTAFGRSLLEAADAAALRTLAALGTLATQNGTFSGTSSGTNTGDNATNTQYSGLAASKQDTLVSATNIKTVNGTSILGSGDLPVTGTQPDIPLTKLAPAANQTITAGFSAYVAKCYEIVDTFTTEIGLYGVLEVG